MSKKDEIIVQSIRDIMNENNLYIYYDKKNTSDRALAYFIDLETFNNVKSAIIDDYETITEKDLNHITYTDNFFTYKNKTLKNLDAMQECANTMKAIKETLNGPGSEKDNESVTPKLDNINADNKEESLPVNNTEHY